MDVSTLILVLHTTALISLRNRQKFEISLKGNCFENQNRLLSWHIIHITIFCVHLKKVRSKRNTCIYHRKLRNLKTDFSILFKNILNIFRGILRNLGNIYNKAGWSWILCHAPVVQLLWKWNFRMLWVQYLLGVSTLQ